MKNQDYSAQHAQLSTLRSQLLAQIAETTEKITAKTKRLKALADQTDTARSTGASGRGQLWRMH